MIRSLRFVKFFLILTVIVTSILTFSIFYTLWKFSPELPSYSKILNYKPNLSSRVYSSDGLLLKSFYTEERIFVPIDKIPAEIIYAFLSSEDKNFYKHKGVDLLAIFRALITNLLS